jgi:hypothetical protein
MNVKDLTQSLLAVIIVGGAVVSLFVPIVNNGASEALRVLAGGVVGYYYGEGRVPTFGARKQ